MSVLLESRPFRPFKSSEEYLYAMKEDLAEWLQIMYPHLHVNVDNFMDKLETGVVLCEHANAVKAQAEIYAARKTAKKMTRSMTGSLAQAQILIGKSDVKYFGTAKVGTFFARDNVSNFIEWCRLYLQILECLLFETDDLILRKNEKHVILCLLEVARRGAKFGMLAPMLVQMEIQIDKEIAADQRKQDSSLSEPSNSNTSYEDDSDSDLEDDENRVLMYGPVPQIVTNDLKSLDEMVRDLVAKCSCPTQFPMIRVSEGKYRIGNTKVLIFVRILRNHVMVRVGGGWDTLEHYLDKHDPCRCRTQHRTTQGAKLVNKPGAMDLHGSHVYYDRSPATKGQNLTVNGHSSSNSHTLGPPMNALNRSRSRSPSQMDSRRSVSPNFSRKNYLSTPNRSRSPTPNYTSTYLTKLNVQRGVKNKPPTHVNSIQIPVEDKIIKTEASLQVQDTDQSDTTSELSDEGYKSLGIPQDKSAQRQSMIRSISLEDMESNVSGHAENDTNDFGLRKTKFSTIIYDNNDGPENRLRSSSLDQSKLCSNCQSSACICVQKDAQTRLVKAPSPRRKHESKTSSWNGRSRQSRPTLGEETFVPPVRNSFSRRSLSAHTSPNKGRLRQDILDTVEQTEDDEQIAEQVKELLKKYKITALIDESSSPEQFNRNTQERISYRSPRKDSKPDNLFSKIPAPVFDKLK